ncbi:MAG: DUF4012 domain-containing protein [Candidatus Microgenomates bacterium]|jgi:hypothetical protein
MQDSGAPLPKIVLEDDSVGKTSDDSILIPKMGVPVDDPPAKVPTLKEVTQKDLPNKRGRSGMILLGVLGLVVLFLVYNLIAGLFVYQKSLKLVSDVRTLYTDANSQDLGKIKTGIDNTKNSLSGVATVYKLIGWEKFLPFAGGYISDAGHAIKAGQAGLNAGETVLTTIQPYSDLLGFKDSSSNVLAAKTGAQTTQDRITFVVSTIPSLLPKIDEISTEVKTVQDEVSQINPDRYPENFKGKPVRSEIQSGQDLVSEVATFIVNGKPFIQSAPYLLGMDAPRTYFVLFQNDKELRPTGGFMTAYAIMKVDKAKFTPVLSGDIYSLDAVYKPSIPAPAPIVTYIKGPYVLSPNWRLRDMNWSPDFATSMQTLIPAAQQAGIGKIDGVIAVDTQLLVNLLNVTGPIGVPGFGNFSTAINSQCNCADVIYQLESFADIEGAVIWSPTTGKIISAPPNYNNRKAIIGPLMNSIMANALGLPKNKLSGLVQAVFTSLIQKHVLFYMLDQNTETAVSDFGVGGRINQDFQGDYLAVNDANLGGRKSNLYAYEQVEQDINVAGDGSVTKTVTITYQNPQSQDGWLNSVLPNWVRVYVPSGSQLISSSGLEAKQDPYTDLGKTVFAGFFQLRPQGVSKVTFEYKLPFKVSKEYDLLMQKQPGTDGFLYTVNVGKNSQEFYLKTDKELKIAI